MMTIETVLEQVAVGRDELEYWIERRWVLPAEREGGHLFDAADVARVRLITELRHELSIDDEAIPVVLSLLDQIYALRGALKELGAAVNTLPEPLRESIKARLH
ncbi:MAG: chaperone modulator CbpM, partial [Alphaproteobacteria bacterium]